MNQNTPGSPVFHCLPQFGQIHVGSFDDTIQPSHPLSSPSPLAFTLSQHQGIFQGVFSSHEMAGVRICPSRFRVDFLQNKYVCSPCSPGDSQESPPAPQFRSINSSVVSLCNLKSCESHMLHENYLQKSCK